VTKDDLYAHPGGESCTFEGARNQVLLLGLQTTFREKLEWLEAAETLVLHLRPNRERESNRVAKLSANFRLPSVEEIAGQP
jgi:hypothetical protein